MKSLKIAFLAAMLCAGFGAPAFAQYGNANNVNPHAEADLQRWIAKDPRLQSDPGLMTTPTYLKNHPNFATWLHDHPNAHEQVLQMGSYDNNHHWQWNHEHQEWGNNGGHTPYGGYGAPPVGEGAYDAQHHWHDSGWWHSNDEGWVHEHHPEWFHNHPEWARAKADVHEARVEHHEHEEHEHHN
jgi:hypothetical protein